MKYDYYGSIGRGQYSEGDEYENDDQAVKWGAECLALDWNHDVQVKRDGELIGILSYADAVEHATEDGELSVGRDGYEPIYVESVERAAILRDALNQRDTPEGSALLWAVRARGRRVALDQLNVDVTEEEVADELERIEREGL